MRGFKKVIAMGAVVAMLCTASVTALAADSAEIAANNGFVCQRTGEGCTLDHEHGVGTVGICCTLDHEHTEGCILPGSGTGHHGNGSGTGNGTGHHGGGRGRHCA